jgi:ABC-2 type transport system permease protein
MWLSLVRDRSAIAMSAFLPVVFFLVFAAIFAGTSGEHLRVRIAYADEVESEASRRLLAALAEEAALEPVAEGPLPTERVIELVTNGSADAGLIIRAAAEPLGSVGGFGAPPLRLVTDPTRAVAARLVAGLAQKAYFTWLPDVALGGIVDFIDIDFVRLQPEQRLEIDRRLEELRVETLAAATDPSDRRRGFEELVDFDTIERAARGRNHVAYYAGGVAILFLLFSAVHGALSMFEERDSGILDRILAGPGRSAALVDGKFLFIVAQGFAQVSIIFVVAWLVYGVDLPGRALGYGIVTLAAATAAAGIALALTSACSTARQAQTLTNVAILITSAIGGSMVPRFFMPQWVQDLGWLTPTTWALEAYTRVFWRAEPLVALTVPVSMLLAIGLLGLWLARRAARRWESL